jgi:hypothetical protein
MQPLCENFSSNLKWIGLAAGLMARVTEALAGAVA